MWYVLPIKWHPNVNSLFFFVQSQLSDLISHCDSWLYYTKEYCLTPSLCHICYSCNRRWWRTAVWTLSSPRGFTPSTNDKRCYPINPTLSSHELPLYIQPCVMLKRSIRTSCTLVPDSWFLSHKNTELTSASYCYLWNISNKLSNLLSQFGVKKNIAKLSVGFTFEVVTSLSFEEHSLLIKKRSSGSVPW